MNEDGSVRESANTIQEFNFASIDGIDIWTKDFPPPDTAEVYVSQEVNLAAVVAMTDLLCPRFVDVEGAVLVERKYSPESFLEWKTRFEGDLRGVESMLNHEHVWDLFQFDSEAEVEDGPSYAALEVVAERMAITWKAAAEAQFPDRSFTCEVTDDYGPTVIITTKVS